MLTLSRARYSRSVHCISRTGLLSPSMTQSLSLSIFLFSFLPASSAAHTHTLPPSFFSLFSHVLCPLPPSPFILLPPFPLTHPTSSPTTYFPSYPSLEPTLPNQRPHVPPSWLRTTTTSPFIIDDNTQKRTRCILRKYMSVYFCILGSQQLCACVFLCLDRAQSPGCVEGRLLGTSSGGWTPLMHKGGVVVDA